MLTYYSGSEEGKHGDKDGLLCLLTIQAQRRASTGIKMVSYAYLLSRLRGGTTSACQGVKDTF